MAQADFQNVFGLDFAEAKALHQRLLGLVGLADDGNHLVNVQQNELATLQNMDAGQHLVEAVLRAPFDRGLAKRNPLLQHLPKGLLRGPAVQPYHGQVDGGRGFQTGVGQ